MNIYNAYIGAFSGLHPLRHTQYIRDIQVAICTQLALMRRRGSQIDGQMVTSDDMKQLKDRGEVQLK